MASNIETEIAAPSPVRAARDQRLQDRLVGVQAGGDVARPRRRRAPALPARRSPTQRRPRPGSAGRRPCAARRGRSRRSRRSSSRSAADNPCAAARRQSRAWPIAPGLRFCTNTSALASMASSSALSSGLREIEHDRFLAAVEPDEIRALAVHDVIVVAREIALRPLDLDDARAGVGQPAVHCGAATACSSETTRRPARGRVMRKLSAVIPGERKRSAGTVFRDYVRRGWHGTSPPSTGTTGQ